MTRRDNIDLDKLSDELRKHESEWVAISQDNEIVGFGDIYKDVVNNLKEDKEGIIMLKMPPAGVVIS